MHQLKRQRRLMAALCAIVATMLAVDAVAAPLTTIAENNILNDPIRQLRLNMGLARVRIQGMLNFTFWALAIIETTYALGMQVVRNGGLEDFMSLVVRRIMYIGFFWWLFKQGPTTLFNIVGGFQKLGSKAAAAPNGLKPDNVLDLGLTVVKVAIGNFSVTDFGAGIAAITASVIVLIAFIVIAANMALVLIEFYILGFAGFVLLAFGGSTYTKDYALAYLKYGVCVGVKFMMMYAIIGTTYQFMYDSVVNASKDNLPQLWTLVAYSVLIAIVVGRLSGIVQTFLAGVSVSGHAASSNAMGAAKSAAGAMSTAAASLAGAAGAIVAAGVAGSERSGGSAAGGAFEGAKALAVGAGQDIAGRISGRDSDQNIYPTGGTMGGAIARNIQKNSGSGSDNSSETKGADAAGSGAA